MSSLLDELTAKEPKPPAQNWYTRLPRDVRAVLCEVRRQWKASHFCTLATLTERLHAKFAGVPPSSRRIGEFVKNECNMFPDTEADDGQGATGRLGGAGGTGAEGRA